MIDQTNPLDGMSMERVFTDNKFDAVITIEGGEKELGPLVTRIVAHVTENEGYVMHAYSSMEKGKVRLGFLTPENAAIASERLKQSCRNSLEGALGLGKDKKKKGKK